MDDKRKASEHYVAVELGEPIVFRTTDAPVYRVSTRDGSLWLRSDQFYRELEDQARCDDFEGVNSSKFSVPLRFRIPDGPQLEITGPGDIALQGPPHYILSMHGPSISDKQLKLFGRCTFGIRSLSKLAAEVLCKASQLVPCTGYVFGKVYYQSASLSVMLNPTGCSPIRLGPLFGDLTLIDTDVLRKRPVSPFIEQDEWRIVIFPRNYLNGDPAAPLAINVDPTHFYEYQSP